MPTYNKVSYDSETYVDTNAGRGLLANDQVILANSEEYYADGSVVMRDNVAFEPVIKCNNTVILCKDKWTVRCDGSEVHIKESY